MSILRKISSFAAATLVAAAPLCIGVCSAPLAQAAPSDTPATSTSTTNPAGQIQDLTKWTEKNCPGKKQFDNNTSTNTPIYLGYANGKTYLGYTNTTWESKVNAENQFVDARTLTTVEIVDGRPKEVPTYKQNIGTCVRVAPDETGQSTAKVYYGTVFKADESALAASGFSENTKTVFQVTNVKPYEEGTTVESRPSESGGNYQEMPHSAVNGSSDSGFINTLLSTENSIELRFTQPGFYRVTLKATTIDPAKPAKIYQSEMPYMFIVGKEAPIPQRLKDDLNDNSGENAHPGTNPPSKPAAGHTGAARNPNPSSSSRLQASSQLGGTNAAGIRDSLSHPRLAQPPANAFPTLPDPATGSSQVENPAGTDPGSAADKDANSDSQAAKGNPLKFQADSTSTDLASKQWIRSSSLAVFALGLGAAGITGIGLLIFSRLRP